MRQRVSIARALAVDPEILLMDEPFASLDAQLRLLLQEELIKLWEQDRRTVIFITHSLDEAIFLGDRVVIMSARPGVLRSEVPIGFPRPRSHELRGTPEFAQLVERTWDVLRDEVMTELDPGSARHGDDGLESDGGKVIPMTDLDPGLPTLAKLAGAGRSVAPCCGPASR